MMVWEKFCEEGASEPRTITTNVICINNVPGGKLDTVTAFAQPTYACSTSSTKIQCIFCWEQPGLETLTAVSLLLNNCQFPYKLNVWSVSITLQVISTFPGSWTACNEYLWSVNFSYVVNSHNTLSLQLEKRKKLSTSVNLTLRSSGLISKMAGSKIVPES